MPESTAEDSEETYSVIDENRTSSNFATANMTDPSQAANAIASRIVDFAYRSLRDDKNPSEDGNYRVQASSDYPGGTDIELIDTASKRTSLESEVSAGWQWRRWLQSVTRCLESSATHGLLNSIVHQTILTSISQARHLVSGETNISQLPTDASCQLRDELSGMVTLLSSALPDIKRPPAIQEVQCTKDIVTALQKNIQKTSVKSGKSTVESSETRDWP